MARDASADWSDVQAEHVSALVDDFEAFCEALVRSEAFHRHVEPLVDGPGGRGVRDGGRDILLTVAQPPSIAKTAYQQAHYLEPLTEDPLAPPEPTRTVYSCKTGKNWLRLAVEDAKERAQRAVEVLAEGGYFKLMIDQPVLLDAERTYAGNQQTPAAHLRDAFWARLRQLDPRAPDPGPRICILDAKKIAAYLRARRPEAPEMDRWAERMQVTSALWSLAQWGVSHETDRGEPTWVEDQERALICGELLERLSDPAPRDDHAVCLVGKPGVGKTRLVLEALRKDRSVAQRVRVAFSADEAERAIDTYRLLKRHPDLVLIVDDCLVEEASAISQHFRRARSAGARACLVLLVPASWEAVRSDLPQVQTWSLSPLLDQSARALVAETAERSSSDPRVVAVARLSQGFPWFARLLAEELADVGRAPADMREAMRWALASRRETSPKELRALQLRRARCLLAASLTHSVDWMELDEDASGRLVRAVGLSSWQELIDGALECDRRGILRRRLGWQFKYVTPQVLEREVIAWLLDPDDGPDPGGRTLSRHGADHLESFFETLARLELHPSVIAGITNVALADLRATRLSKLVAAGFAGSRLRFLARHRPGETARELRRMVEEVELDELRAQTAERRPLVWALEVTLGGRTSLADSESALFRLACAENEGYANNATQTWAHLFVPELPSTHSSVSERVGLLARRLASEDPRARLIALQGVEPALSSFASWTGPRVRERGWIQPTTAQARDGRLRIWGLLIGRFDDADARVASRARRQAIEHLRDALTTGVGAEVLAGLARHVGDWSLDERVLLREALWLVRQHDVDYLDALGEDLAQLQDAVAPRSFHERLRQRVCVWQPELEVAEEERLDDELAREGLRGDVPLRDELDWLASSKAERGHVFAYAIGRCDNEATLVGELRRVAAEHPESWQAQALLGRYLGGMASAGRGEQAESLLRTLQANPSEANASALAIVELGATPDRVRWLERALTAGQIHASAIEELGRRNTWFADIDDKSAFGLLTVLARGGAPERVAALSLVVDHYRGDAMTREVCDLLERLLIEFAQVDIHPRINHHWSRALGMLIDQGRVARAAQLAVAALSRSSGANQLAWRALHAATERDPSASFAAVAEGLETQGPGGKLLVSFWFHRQPFAWPTDDILEWVGEDERRARAAAGLVQAPSERFPEPARALVQRFGPHGSVARELGARLMSTRGLVASLAEHDLQKLALVRTWVEDPDPSVAALAESIVEMLERSYERHAAQEADERERYGT